jgi:hypothetical protein
MTSMTILIDAWLTRGQSRATSTSPTHHGENRKYKEPASLKLNAKPRSRFLPRSRLLPTTCCPACGSDKYHFELGIDFHVCENCGNRFF